MPNSRKRPESLSFLDGPGPMRERIRAFDWRATSLGPLEGWPQSLKTALQIALNSRYPIWLGWGRELIFFYNDAYIPVLGKRDEQALGASARVVWEEIWEQHLGPQADAVLSRGEASWNERRQLVMLRNGYPEETYFTFSFSPIPADPGGVGGLFCACTEDTQEVLGERRLSVLRQLGENAARARTEREASELIAETLAANDLDVSFALLYLTHEKADELVLAAAAGLRGGAPWAPAVLGIDDELWPLRDAVQHGPQVLRELSRFEGLPGGAWPEACSVVKVLPLAKAGQEAVRGFLIAGASPRLPFDRSYDNFFDLLARGVRDALSNARAHEDEKKRAEALAELDRAKTAFFSNVSHEFRTPLTLILGPIEEMLAKRDRARLQGTRTDELEPLETVHRNALRLLKLVNTMLDFSRIEAGRVKARFEPVDLAAYTAELASVFRSAMERAGLEYVVECPPLPEPVFVDRDMWEKVVLNLLSNAFKFTLEGRIEVRMESADAHARLTVRDTGVGIPSHEIPHMFDRFHRVANTRGRTHEGTGIGLALVQELVRLHGGTVSVESALDQGSQFTVFVPFGRAHLDERHVHVPSGSEPFPTSAPAFVEEALRWLPDREPDAQETLTRSLDGAPAATPSSRESGRRERVLWADDNADMREYVRRLLATRYDVEAVPDGQAALDAARANPPDLVLSDVMMPRLDGFGLVRELRADSRLVSIPIILLSARAGEDARLEGASAGVDDYLIKPFSARELLARVESNLQMARARWRLQEVTRRNEERLRMALGAARMVAWQWDPESDVVTTSDNVAEVYGLAEGETVEKSSQGFLMVHPDDLDRHRETVMNAVRDQSSYFSQFRVIRPVDHGVMWMEERGQVEKDPATGRVKIHGIVMDITERKQTEFALQEADRRKDEFLATLAHELRNPLAPVTNSLQLLRRGLADPASHTRVVDMLDRQVQHMVRLIEDLMEVSRITRGKIELRRELVELSDIVRSAAETVRPVLDKAGHRLTVDLPAGAIVLVADPVRISQVIVNLLDNSVKYTPEGGHIVVSAVRDGDHVVLSVRDDGLGIPAEMLPRVFDLFTQVDRTLGRSHGGLGIGLALVRSLVEMHGGSVEATSEGPGRGSEFRIRLPLTTAMREPRPGATAGEAEYSGLLSGRRVLVVDDNRDATDSLSMLLVDMGADVLTRYDGPSAIEAIREHRPHVVFLDIGMPGMSGYTVATEVRKDPALRDVKLVALTGWGQEEDRRQSSAAGFDAHEVKPIVPRDLVRLAGALSLRPGDPVLRDSS